LIQSWDKPNFVPQNAGRLSPKKKRRRPWRSYFGSRTTFKPKQTFGCHENMFLVKKIRLFTISSLKKTTLILVEK